MKKRANPLDRLRGLTDAVFRFPLTAALLLTAAVFMALQIQTSGNYEIRLLTCAVGALLGAALQTGYERFYHRQSTRLLLYGGGIILTIGYYLIVRQAPEYSQELSVRTGVTLFALLFAFLLVPVIKSRITFNESFMAAFKGFFHALLYAAVLFGGCALIVAAIDNLIVNVSSRAYAHIANLVFVLFGPLLFLSLMPVFPGEGDGALDRELAAARDERVRQASVCPKFLEVLLSYIVVPLTAAFTVILVLYIALNVRGAFWDNNLLEPLLISYSVTVILVYILTSRMENRFAVLFRRVFPKVLIPIVIFQLIASALMMRDSGVTYGRYYVILFGVFAVCAGAVMSVMPVRKNGVIAALLIAFSVVSVIPPVDAFTVSRHSQQNRLEAVLIRNGMLVNNTVTPNSALSDEDKEMITASVEYLDRMGYTGRVAWLPADFEMYRDFSATFGFSRYDMPPDGAVRSVYVSLDSAVAIPVTGYDVLAQVSLNQGVSGSIISHMEHNGAAYTVQTERDGNVSDLVLTDAGGRELVRLPGDDIYNRYGEYAWDKTELTLEEATFSAQGNGVDLTLIVQNASIQMSQNKLEGYFYVNAYLLIRFA